MILKFKSAVLGCWVYESQVYQVKVGQCTFRPPQEGEECTSVEVRNGTKLVPLFADSIVEAAIDFDWIVDDVPSEGSDEFKWIRAQYAEKAGWATTQRTFIFSNASRVYLLNDEGKTIERL